MNAEEFIPIISRASICSETRIVPISEAMLEPTFPAKIKAIIVGENSSTRDSLVANPIKYFGIKGLLNCKPVCIVTTAPINNEIIDTIVKEFTPNFTISSKILLKYTFLFSGLLNTFPNKERYLPNILRPCIISSKIIIFIASVLKAYSIFEISITFNYE